MIINGTNLSMIRGDSESIVLTLQEGEEKSSFLEGDTLYLTVKERVISEEKTFQKVVTEFNEDGTATIEILPEDTKDVEFKTYVYDIQLTRKDGAVTTIIPPSDFTIKGEVTYE